MDIQLEDLVYTYPDWTTPNFQKKITEKWEFQQLAGFPNERLPEGSKPGTLFRHQKLLLRYMLVYDRLLLIHRTGTGKSCTAFGTSELFRQGMMQVLTNFYTLYLQPKRTNIVQIVVVSPSETLSDELKDQLVRKCSDGYYLTEEVRMAPTERSRTQRRNMMIRNKPPVEGLTDAENELRRTVDQYEFTTYEKLAEKLDRLSDEAIRLKYPDRMFICDEIHRYSIKDAEDIDQYDQTTKIKSKNVKVMKNLERLFQLAPRSKIYLMSATPMTGRADELISIINLLHPPENRIPPKMSLVNASFEEFYPYIRGLVSFVRELDTGIEIINEGIVVPNTVRDGNQELESQVVISPVEMSEFQTENYLNLRAQKLTPIDRKELFAANIIFPDQTHGREASTKFITKVQKKPDWYRVTPLFKESLDEFGIETFSAKFDKIIRLCLEPMESCFVYSNYLAMGSYLMAALLSYVGIEQYSGVATGISSFGDSSEIIIDKRPRFALITSETTNLNIRKIKDLFNHPDNRYGEYLKILIGSEISQTGLNLANVQQIHIVDPAFNYADTYQAISRAIRSTSHNDLIKDRPGEPIRVRLWRHVSVPAIENGILNSIEYETYLRAERKNIEVRRIERFLKVSAIDCQIHKRRNIRPGDLPYTPDCDYQDECDYACVDEAPTREEIDYSSFDVLYADQLVSDIEEKVITFFKQRFSATLEEIYLDIETVGRPILEHHLTNGQTFVARDLDYLLKLRPDFIHKYVQRAITQIIIQRKPIQNLYGFESYLQMNGKTVYLQRDFPNGSPFTGTINSNNSRLIVVEEKTLESELQELTLIENSDFLEQVYSMDPSDPDFSSYIEDLDFILRVNLIEDAIQRGETKIIDYFKRYIFYFKKADIDFLVSELSQSLEEKQLVVKPGRKTKKLSIKSDEIEEKMRSVGLETLKPPVYPNLKTHIAVHNYYSREPKASQYNAKARTVKVIDKVRVLTDRKWRDVHSDETLSPIEFEVYKKAIEDYQASVVEQAVSDLGGQIFYGEIGTDGKFKIVFQIGNMTDERQISRGKTCSSHPIPQLIYFLHLVGYRDPEVDRLELPNNFRENSDLRFLTDFTGAGASKMKGVDFDQLSEPVKDYLARWLYATDNKLRKKTDICRALEANIKKLSLE